MSTTKIKIKPHSDDQKPTGGGTAAAPVSSKDPVGTLSIEYDFAGNKTTLTYTDKDTAIGFELIPDSKSRKNKICIEHTRDAEDALIIEFAGSVKSKHQRSPGHSQVEVTTLP